jgi:hypothetical protein
MVMSRKVSKNAAPEQIAALKAQKESLIDRIITIGGKDYRGLANTFTNEFATGEAEYGMLSPEEQ